MAGSWASSLTEKCGCHEHSLITCWVNHSDVHPPCQQFCSRCPERQYNDETVNKLSSMGIVSFQNPCFYISQICCSGIPAEPHFRVRHFVGQDWQNSGEMNTPEGYLCQTPSKHRDDQEKGAFVACICVLHRPWIFIVSTIPFSWGNKMSPFPGRSKGLSITLWFHLRKISSWLNLCCLWCLFVALNTTLCLLALFSQSPEKGFPDCWLKAIQKQPASVSLITFSLQIHQGYPIGSLCVGLSSLFH